MCPVQRHFLPGLGFGPATLQSQALLSYPLDHSWGATPLSFCLKGACHFKRSKMNTLTTGAIYFKYLSTMYTPHILLCSSLKLKCCLYVVWCNINLMRSTLIIPKLTSQWYNGTAEVVCKLWHLQHTVWHLQALLWMPCQWNNDNGSWVKKYSALSCL